MPFFFFFRRAWPPFYGLDSCPRILGVLGIDCSYTCHSFSIRWLSYSSKCSNTCWNWYFPILDGTTRCPSHVILGCPLSCPTLWKPNGSILPPIVGFFSESLTWTKVCFPSSKRSFEYRMSAFLFMCESKGKCLVINLSYHNNISFIIGPFAYNITYLS
jgi:hypothetical protein